ncbi:hypothetical protein AYI69_g5567 [Smittium culicis]|uniref:Uncharacterized protein n=1 Tax=Smittium culicis TaxID=133412 RepID=A0A1R1Y536_9FUNG|nr:hypothetical protein AYI69_g5567 [Smittium culicis]
MNRFGYLREVVADTADERGLVHAFVNSIVYLVDVRKVGPELDPKLVAAVCVAVECQVDPETAQVLRRHRVYQRACYFVEVAVELGLAVQCSAHHPRLLQIAGIAQLRRAGRAIGAVPVINAARVAVRHRIEPADTRAFAGARVKQRAHLKHRGVEAGCVQARSVDDVARDDRKARAAALHGHRVAVAAGLGYAGDARVCRHDRAGLFDVAGEREHQLVLRNDPGRRAAEDVPAAADIVEHRIVANARRRACVCVCGRGSGARGDKLARREDARADVELARLRVHGEEVRLVLVLAALRNIGICGAAGRSRRGDDVLADTFVPHVLGLAVGVHELVALDAEFSLQRVGRADDTGADDQIIDMDCVVTRY